MNIKDVLASDLSDSLKTLMVALVATSEDGKTSYASVAQLAGILGCSERSVHSRLRDLEWGNCIKSEGAGGRGMSSVRNLLLCKMTPKRVKGKIVENQRNDNKSPYIEKIRDEDVTLREREERPAAVNRRLIVIKRRQAVRDGFLSLLSIMNDGEYITAPGLAKHLGMNAAQVRTDLMALFRTFDIPLDAQRRFRKSQRKPWHWRKMDGKVVNFCDHYEGGKREGRG